MLHLKRYLKRRLEQSGWYLRRSVGLSAGTDLFHDLRHRLGVTRPKILFDVGAHRGETTLAFRNQFPSARVFSFEPVQSNYTALTINTGNDKKVTTLNCALGDSKGFANIILQADSMTHSLNRLAQSSVGIRASEYVSVHTIDGVLEEWQIDRIDLLKIDTEGYEAAVLRGAHDALNAARIGAIFAEATLDPKDRDHSQLADLAALLGGYGFRLYAIYDQQVWADPLRLAYFNALFIPGPP